MIGAVDFTRRSRTRMSQEPWVSPLNRLEPSNAYPDPFLRIDADFYHDLVILAPGKSYMGYIRVPDDSVIRLIDLCLSVYLVDDVDGRRYFKRVVDSSAHPLFPQVSGSMSGEIQVELSNASTGTPLIEGAATSGMFQSIRPRPGGKASPLNQLLAPRSIVQYIVEHKGNDNTYAVSGSFRGYRSRF